MDAAGQEKRKQKPSGRHTMYKLHIGWRHYCQGDFRQITSRRGGGIRKMEYNITEPQSVESIIEVGKRLFFPNGRNSFGNLNDMEVNLTNYSGEKIERFCNIDEQPCTFQEFLKSTGRYSSQFHVYLSTKSITYDKIKPLEETSETSYLANRKTIQGLHVQYTKNETSEYSGDTSIITCHSTKQCRELSGIPDDIDDYDPLEDGYNVTYLAVNDKVYMERTSSGLSFPQDVAGQDSAYIFHGPNEICGMNEGKVVLGVVTNCSENVNYTWYKDQSIYAAGINLMLIHTNDTGVYNVKCQVGETLYTFEESVEIALPATTDRYDMDMRIDSEVTENLNTTHFGITADLKDCVSNTAATDSSLDMVTQTFIETSDLGENDGKGTHSLTTTTFICDKDGTCANAVSAACETSVFCEKDGIGANAVSTFLETSVIHERDATGANAVLTFPETSVIHEKDGTGATAIPTIPETIPETSAMCVNNGTGTNTISTIPKVDVICEKDGKCSKTVQTIPATSVIFEKDGSDANTVSTGYFCEKYGAAVNKAPTVTETSILIENECTCSNAISTVTETSFLGDVTTEFLDISTGFVDSVETRLDKDENENDIKAKLTGKNSRKSMGSSDNLVAEQPPVKKGFTQLDANTDNLNVRFGDFKLLEKIGEGGFGEVYKGEYLGTDIAVKKVKIKRMKVVKQSVLQEVVTNSHLRHPNIVLLMGYSINTDCLYLLTEFIAGPNLDDVLFADNEYEFTVPQKHAVALQVCQGVAYLHNHNPIVIHRDIKPENILLTRNLETAKLCDMGLSKVKVMNTMTKTVADRRETQPGTPAYQAPEILLQARRGRTQADVWSLCCSLVELFTAKTIWDLTSEDDENDDSVQVIIRAMQRKDMPHGLSNLDREHTLSVQLKAVIQKGLSYQIEDRPTALDFVVALKHEL
ncbi:uncharacterized protein LOC128215309 [Mya arenaria]|uniref:uncharacterized protein LOC128215309 n=4 Tax=Mya arenaria TaxID=6604 RepID=UPI0022E2BB72|nr:uncharacterized protein LOC128215309 [Mya arenaria]